MTIEEILQHICLLFPDLVVVDAWGEKSVFYNPSGLLARGVYFCTLKEKDGENDSASHLYRENVFRLSFGVSKKTYITLFGAPPVRPAKGHVVNVLADFTQLNQLMPHPVYGWMSWVCILNPSLQKLKELELFLGESYELVLEKHIKRTKT